MPENRHQQPSGDRQADTFGLRRGGKAGEGVRIEHGHLLALTAQKIALGAERVVSGVEFLQLLLVVGAIDGLKDVRSVAVKGLPRSTGAGGLSGDGTVGPVEDSGGGGDAKVRR